jgi:hypothetical protein
MTYIEKPTVIKHEIASSLSTRFRESLSSLGLSRDMHIFDLDFSHLPSYYDKDALEFIGHIQTFYLTLDPLDRMVFMNEYLEYGRHNAIWWMRYFTAKDYTAEMQLMNNLVKKNLGGKLYGD